MDIIVRELKKLNPDLKLFLDRIELNPGTAWQQRIYEALEECRKIIAVFSPAYLVSNICKEEYNIAHYLNRNATKEILIPIYLYSTQLPVYMKLVQYIDCREGDNHKLKKACNQINSMLKK